MSLLKSKKAVLESNIMKLLLFVAVLLVIFIIILKMTGALSSIKCAIKSIFGQVC